MPARSRGSVPVSPAASRMNAARAGASRSTILSPAERISRTA